MLTLKCLKFGGGVLIISVGVKDFFNMQSIGGGYLNKSGDCKIIYRVKK